MERPGRERRGDGELRVLVVDDSAVTPQAVTAILGHEPGMSVEAASDPLIAMQKMKVARPDVIVLDLEMPRMDGITFLRKLMAEERPVPVVICSSLAVRGSEAAVRALEEGAVSIVTKPKLGVRDFLYESAVTLIDAVRAAAQARVRPRRLRAAPPLPVVPKLSTDAVLAAKKPTLSVTTDQVVAMDTELFGHEKGAFTGAVTAKVGLLEVAHKGTVFLDEIGDLDAAVQPKLLKVLEEKRFRRLGEVRDRQVDVRLVAATHHDLQALVREKKFRRDLYFRISTIPLRVPPLRERRDDIPVLAQHFLERMAPDLGRGRVALSAAATAALAAHAWPGNLRELRNALERAVLLCGGPVLEPRDFRFEGDFDEAPSGTLAEMERRHIERVLREEDGQVERAAKRLGIPRSTLYQRLKQFGPPARP